MTSKEIEEESREEGNYLLNDQLSKAFPTDSEHRPSKRPWILVAVVSAITLASIGINFWLWSQYQSMFQTDLPDARKAIQYEQRKYTGALVYDEQTKPAIRVKDAPVEYFGSPDEVDAAWDDLLKGAFKSYAILRPH